MAWVDLGVAAIGAAGAVGSAAISKGKNKGGGSGPSVDFLDTRNPDQLAVDNSLSSWITKYLPGFVPGQAYSGKFTAPMSTYEQQGLGFLQNYLNQPDQTPLLGQAQNEISKTLTGGYDPYTSDFYKSARSAAMLEQGDAQKSLDAQVGARGKYFSSEALNENQQLQTRTTNYLQNILGNLSQNERQNRLAVIPQALATNQAITSAPAGKAATAETLGALPRQIDQNDLEAQYQAFLNQRSEMALPVGAASGFRSQPLKTVGTNNPPAPQFDWQGFLGSLTQQGISSFASSFN